MMVKLWILKQLSAICGNVFEKKVVRMNKNGIDSQNKLCNSQKALKKYPKN